MTWQQNPLLFALNEPRDVGGLALVFWIYVLRVRGNEAWDVND